MRGECGTGKRPTEKRWKIKNEILDGCLLIDDDDLERLGGDAADECVLVEPVSRNYPSAVAAITRSRRVPITTRLKIGEGGNVRNEKYSFISSGDSC